MKEENLRILKEMMEKGYVCNDIEWKAETFSTEEILKWKEKFEDFKKKIDK